MRISRNMDTYIRIKVNQCNYQKMAKFPYFGSEISSEGKFNEENNTRIYNIYTFYQIIK
jgi:hypothetical protein